VVATTPAAAVRADLEEVYQERLPLPAVLRPLYEDPAVHLPAVVQEMHRYWQAVIQPVWPRLRALSMADLSYRMEQFAGGGLASVLEHLHPNIAFANDLLQIDKPHHCHHRFDLAGTGIVLVPCGFSWPTLIVHCCGVDQPELTYSPRGVGELWQESPAEQPDPWLPWWAGPGPRCWRHSACQRPPRSSPPSWTSARPRSASTSRSSRIPPWSPRNAADGWCSTSGPQPPPPCWRPSSRTRKPVDLPVRVTRYRLHQTVSEDHGGPQIRAAIGAARRSAKPGAWPTNSCGSVVQDATVSVECGWS